MLQRIFRLPASVRLSHAEAMYTPYFIVKIARNNLDNSRYGFIVSKKIDKRAVGRNQLKRRFRSGIEQILEKVASGYDMLFLLKKDAIEMTTQKLHDEIKNVLLKKGLVKTENRV